MYVYALCLHMLHVYAVIYMQIHSVQKDKYRILTHICGI